MCNLYANTTAQQAMRQLFDIASERDRLGNAQPYTGIRPRHSAPVVRLTSEGDRELVEMSWGFRTPGGTNKLTGKPKVPAVWNNARDDKLLSSGLWKSSFEGRRCLIPGSSFCETTGQRPATYHWFAIEGVDDRPAFAFAGMWARFYDGVRREDDVHDVGHTMITTTPNSLVENYHNRMPVILDPAHYDTWLNGTVEEAHALLRPFPADRMRRVRHGLDQTSDPLAD